MTIVEQFQAHRTLTVALGALLLLVTVVGVFTSVKKISPAGWGWHGPVNQSGGVAIRGYDPVALAAGEVSLGSVAHELTLDGTTWRFTSAAHRTTFEADPTRYAPAFGGFCAFAMSKGFTADSDPTAHTVRDGTLYLFDSEKMKSEWVAALDAGAIEAGQRNWATH